MAVLLVVLAAAFVIILNACGVTSDDVDLFKLGIGIWAVGAALAWQTHRPLP